MEINWKTSLYCLIGNPIEWSLSPLIHNSIFNLLNIDSVYLTFNVVDQNLKIALEGLKSIEVKGFNVTIPHKKNIIKHLDHISEEAKIIGAVNTVKNIDGKLIGYNTDGEGFLQTFKDNNINLKDKNILLLGAGGAAFAIGGTLAKYDVNSITIANRSLINAKKLENKINLINKNIITNTIELNSDFIDKKNIDIIINSTSVGMYPMENMTPIELNGFNKELIVYDIVYKPRESMFLKEAKLQGYKTFNGISMLINQGILSQKIWLEDISKINLEITKKIEGILENM